LSFQRKLESRKEYERDMQENNYYVYILANKRNGTLYIGVTNNLTRRILEHKEKIIKGFTSKYGVDKLVYFEMHKYINNALQRESNIKAWKRKWKLELIESNNKNWNDLFYDLTTEDEIKDLKELIKKRRAWIPAFAGMTKLILNFCNKKKADFGQPF
jgi:putative endonuclease